MAKSKSFFGLRRGSTKSMTFQVLNGAQITKDRVVDVKNPRTRTQMVQRMIMATAGSAYKHMREIVDHSFEGVSYGQRSYSEFMRLNVHDMVEDVRGDLGQFSYNPFGDTGLYPSPFIIARGSLKYNSALAGFYEEPNTVFVQLPALGSDNEKPSVSEQAAAWGLQLGDVLTFAFIFQTSVNNTWEFGFLRIMFRKESDSELNEDSFRECFDIDSSLPVLVADYSSKTFYIMLETPVNVELDVFGTTILSRRSNSRWLRSNAQIIFPGSPVNSPTAAEALATYPIGTDYILNGANIGGGGIAPDNRLRIVSRMSVACPIEEDTYSEFPNGKVPVCVFNRIPQPEEIVGNLKFVLQVLGSAVTLPVNGTNGEGYFYIGTTDGSLTLILDGVTLYTTDYSEIYPIWDVDLNGQHRRGNTSIEKSGYISIGNPKIESDEGYQLVCQYFISQQNSSINVCSNGDLPMFYNPVTQQFGTDAWAGGNSELVKLVTELFRMEFVENAIDGTLDDHQIEGNIQSSFNLLADSL